MKNKYTPIIGLEIHVELNTKSKMFCGCPANHFGVEPNTQVCPVCYGLPGALPIANEEAIRRTIKIGLALDAAIASHSKFDRKNYFYPDLPKGYQISQYDEPLCEGGEIDTSFGSVRLTRIHLEEDTAKIAHIKLTDEQKREAGVDNNQVSLIDFNRSGVPLVEIVTEADIHSAAQAREFAKKLVQILRYLDVSDCDMEKGALRLEANISVQTQAEAAAGQLPPYKVEIKNLNSFRFLERAINFEIDRHIQIRDKGKLPSQETRGWNDSQGYTYSQRSKEEAEDYRYFPDPDLPELKISAQMIETIAQELPSLPDQVKAQLITDYGLSDQNAEVLTSDRQVAEVGFQFLDQLKKQKLDIQAGVNALVNKKVVSWLLEPAVLVEKSEQEIQTEIVKTIEQIKSHYSFDKVAETDIDQVIKEVLSDKQLSTAVNSWRDGEDKIAGFLIGQVMHRIGKKVDAKIVANRLQQQR